MPTELEQKVIEYAIARGAVRATIRETQGKGLNITPEMVRRMRAAEEELLKAGELLLIGQTLAEQALSTADTK